MGLPFREKRRSLRLCFFGLDKLKNKVSPMFNLFLSPLVDNEKCPGEIELQLDSSIRREKQRILMICN
jgi:hypothetical protein